MSEQGRENEGGRVVLFLLLGLVVLFGGGYVAAYLAAGDNVPRGTTIAGVEVGGRSREAAVAALERGLAERSTAPIPVSVDEARRGQHHGGQHRPRGCGPRGRRRGLRRGSGRRAVLGTRPVVGLLHRR